jgi:hypothetical protein
MPANLQRNDRLMDETQTPTTPNPSPSDLTDLQEQCLWLRKQIQTQLILMIIVSGTLCLFLLRQVRYAKAELTRIRPQAQQMIAEYNKVLAPSMDNFVRNIAIYGQSHPDFAPIMVKYNLATVTNLIPPKPAPAVPPPAPAAKK